MGGRVAPQCDDDAAVSLDNRRRSDPPDDVFTRREALTAEVQAPRAEHLGANSSKLMPRWTWSHLIARKGSTSRAGGAILRQRTCYRSLRTMSGCCDHVVERQSSAASGSMASSSKHGGGLEPDGPARGRPRCAVLVAGRSDWSDPARTRDFHLFVSSSRPIPHVPHHEAPELYR